MAEFKFEGEVESLTPNQLELISKVLQDKGLKDNTVKIETLGQAGDNYAAYVKLITVQLDGDETFTMVAKIAPIHEMARVQMGIDLLFSNECIMYNHILPTFTNLQRDSGIPEEELFRYPKCYGSSMEPMNEIILLENLTKSNFEILDRFTVLSNESVKRTVKKFALFHSLSFVLNKQDPNKFEEYGGKFKDFFGLLANSEPFKFGMSIVEEDMLEKLDDNRYESAIRGSLTKIGEHFSKSFKREANSRYSVFIHGDAWNNNFMFRLENGEPVEVIFIDYQVSKLGSPVCDLQHMIFCCTDHATRQKHYHEWMDIYHDELDKYLNYFGLKANYVYPRDQMDADLRRHSRFYFSNAMLMYSVLIRKTEDAAKMKDAFENNATMSDITESMRTSNLDTETSKMFKKKVVDLVDSYRDFGYL